MQRLGQNNGGYQGECIDIRKVLGEIENLALAQEWKRDPIVISDQAVLPAFVRAPTGARQHVYISSGIHGDEPAGPLAVLQLFQEKRWTAGAAVSLVPCLNPRGFERNCRENEEGIDLNRDYRAVKTALVRAHVEWLGRQPRFDVTLLLHEDWESNGFYLYELNPARVGSFSDTIIEQVQRVCPIDTAPQIEGRPAQNGVICANPDLMKRPDWPEAFYLIHNKSPLSYTLEAPSDFELQVRVRALVEGVCAVLETFATSAES